MEIISGYDGVMVVIVDAPGQGPGNGPGIGAGVEIEPKIGDAVGNLYVMFSTTKE